MDTTTIKQEIDDNIKPNGVGAITGQVLNGTLNDMVDAIAPKMYSEDVDGETAEIQTSLIKLDGNSVRITTNGGNAVIEGSFIEFESKDHNVFFHIGGDGLNIVLSQFFSLEFNTMDGFQVQLHDGDAPYVMMFDLLNGLQFGDVNIQARLDDLQEQINELKNQ